MSEHSPSPSLQPDTLGDPWQATTGLVVPTSRSPGRAELNATDGPIPTECLHELFMRQAEVRPEAPAVLSGDRSMTYGELRQHAAAVAGLLLEAGVERNLLVGVMMEKGWAQVPAVLGVLEAGAAYLPIDPGLPLERIELLLEDADISVVLTQAAVAERVDLPARLNVIEVDTVDIGDTGDAIGAASRAFELRSRPDDLAYVIYTSGSTGRPKGVMIDHRGAVNTIIDINERFGICPSDRVLSVSSLAFDLSVWDIFGILAAGGAVVLPEPDRARDPDHWLELIGQWEVTVWNTVPALIGMLVDAAAVNGGDALASLRLALLSGDWIALDLPDAIRSAAPRAQVISLGGATEGSIWSILYPIESVDPGWKSIPYGRPMRNQRFYIFNSALEECPDWVSGELYIGGAGVALGYWHDEARTNGSFIRHPVSGERLYRTGDLGRFNPSIGEGVIEFLGRNDLQVKINGFRVELGEIEATLQALPGVGQAVVAAIGEPTGSRKLVAYVVGSEGAEPDTEELQVGLAEKLPSYMVPATFITLDRLPLTANGKVDRKGLPLPDAAAGPREQVYVPPETELQERLVAIWAAVLEAEGAGIGILDNFFELGGSSLLVVRLVRQVFEQLGVELKIRQILEEPTITHMAAIIDSTARGEEGAWSPLVRIQGRGNRPGFFFVPAADGNVFVFKKLTEHLGEEQPFYSFQLPLGVEGQEVPERLEEIAAEYLAAMKEVQPEGPYVLGGYCWGCTVAMEMGHQLLRAGEEVPLLLLIDPLHRDYYGYFLQADAYMAGLMVQIMNPGKDVSLMAFEHLIGLDFEQQLTAIYNHVRESGDILPEITYEDFKEIFSLFRRNLAALVAYTPDPYPANAGIVLVEDYPPDWFAYWERMSVEGFKVINLPGNHYSIWSEEDQVRKLYEEIRALMADLPALEQRAPIIGSERRVS